MRLASACLFVGVLVGCSKSTVNLVDSGTPSDGKPPDGGGPGPGPGHTPGMPGRGAHSLKFYHLDADPSSQSLSTSAMATQSSGSTIIVGVGRGNSDEFTLPIDNKGNSPYQQLGTVQPYHHWQYAGTALYAFTNARGGADFSVTTNRGRFTDGRPDEATMSVVEVIEGTRIQDYSWHEVVDPSPTTQITSRSVTTTGPATLIAFWWGDAFPGTPQSATAGDGFHPVDSNASETDSFVQCAVAYKNVSAAGTYTVTWTSDPVQGAQLWLVAVGK